MLISIYISTNLSKGNCPHHKPMVAHGVLPAPVPLLIGWGLSGDPDAANPLACQNSLSLRGMKEQTSEKEESPSIKNTFSFSF